MLQEREPFQSSAHPKYVPYTKFQCRNVGNVTNHTDIYNLISN